MYASVSTTEPSCSLQVIQRSLLLPLRAVVGFREFYAAVQGCCRFCGECRSGAVWTIQIHFADKEEGECLLCLTHTELLGVSQIVYGENDKVLYYNEQYIRSDIYKYVTGR